MDKIIDNTNGFHFTIIDNYILNNASLSALEQIVYVHLKKYSSQSNKCFPGINKLAQCIASSSNTVRKALKSLKEKGFIDIQQRFNASNEYTLLPYPQYEEELRDDGRQDVGEDKDISKVLKFYQNNINPIYGSLERDKLIGWFDTFEGNGDILVRAIEMAVLQGVRKIKYIDSILVNWQQSGIKSLEQCESYQKDWEERRRGIRNVTGDIGKNKGSDTEKRYDFSKFGDLQM